MAKKNVKLVAGMTILFSILLFISIFTSFFLPVEIEAVGNDGHWEEFPNGRFECIAPGSECGASMRDPVG